MLEMSFGNFDNIIVLDTETTGIDHKRDEIIELAAIRAARGSKGFEIEDEFDLLIQLSPGKKLPGLITNLTGISERQLLDEGVSKAAACARLTGMLECENTLLAAYNAQFDLCFIYYLLDSFGKAEVLKNVKMLDAMTVYKDRRPYPHKLSDAVEAYSLKTQNTHRAVDDARATLELLREMEKESGDLARYINLFGYNPRYGVSGQKISSVKYMPQPYFMTGKLYENAPLGRDVE